MATPKVPQRLLALGLCTTMALASSPATAHQDAPSPTSVPQQDRPAEPSLAGAAAQYRGYALAGTGIILFGLGSGFMLTGSLQASQDDPPSPITPINLGLALGFVLGAAPFIFTGIGRIQGREWIEKHPNAKPRFEALARRRGLSEPGQKGRLLYFSGVITSALGGMMLTAGIGLAPDPDNQSPTATYAILGTGGAMLLAGIPMMIFGRRRTFGIGKDRVALVPSWSPRSETATLNVTGRF